MCIHRCILPFSCSPFFVVAGFIPSPNTLSSPAFKRMLRDGFTHTVKSAELYFTECLFTSLNTSLQFGWTQTNVDTTDGTATQETDEAAEDIQHHKNGGPCCV